MIKAFIRLNKRISHYCEQRWASFFGGDNCTSELSARIDRDLTFLKPQRILECGGIDRPLLKKSHTYRYIGLDIEDRDICHLVYDEFLVQSVEDPLNTKADMIISTTLLEHVRDNRKAIAQIFNALSVNGTTHHYIPSKHHPYSLILRILGPRMQIMLIRLLRSEATEVSGYPAFFNHCVPHQMRELFERTGFREIDIQPFYRANDYFDFFLPAYFVVTALENLCRKLDWQIWCSGFVISAKKCSV